MKKTIYSLALASLLAASPAFAQEGEVKARAGVSVPTRVKVEAQTSAEVRVRQASSTRSTDSGQAERRATIQASVAKRMVERAGKVMQATIERLEKLSARIESRIAKVKVEGGATAESEAALAAAKVHIGEAKAELKTFLAISLTSEQLSENVSTLRTAAAKVKVHLREAHAALVKSVVALKPGRTEAKVRATSTATTTNQ